MPIITYGIPLDQDLEVYDYHEILAIITKIHAFLQEFPDLSAN